MELFSFQKKSYIDCKHMKQQKTKEPLRHLLRMLMVQVRLNYLSYEIFCVSNSPFSGSLLNNQLSGKAVVFSHNSVYLRE